MAGFEKSKPARRMMRLVLRAGIVTPPRYSYSASVINPSGLATPLP